MTCCRPTPRLRRCGCSSATTGRSCTWPPRAGAPTLGLFGPTDERIWAPWGAHARALRGPRTPAEILKVDPQMNQAICHMLDLSVGAVMKAARRLLYETEPAGG